MTRASLILRYLALVGLLLATLTTLLANLAADLCYLWLDPRITYR